MERERERERDGEREREREREREDEGNPSRISSSLQFTFHTVIKSNIITI